ncbi:hypothetical protein ASPZODRAFT_149907 [Penicilliopsis zonata CBS 506.65]|uniref:AB hydrolase-1 domain-containing protein n=1 Tax=Penicilliopsis zonata CBS 506.65 TaxID=1073090 RepID=A0A1L9SP10_9EURO|nr:hypothetical protein ASPZODRAFT_149907 [Penicilliopsis zonata CBS 506.65]OJJ48930.1 hypothetical protein ASPZODRAFT_149907 [Penicilliopsis zonata CBS 506.65]
MVNLQRLLFSVLGSSALPGVLVDDSLKSDVIGGLYQPASWSPQAKIAVYVMHAEVNYASFSACTALAERGYTVLCANNALDKTGFGAPLGFEEMMLMVGSGMRYLRSQPGIEKVVLFGHSGGGAMMADYQNIAENGAGACNGTEKIYYRCSSAMDGLLPADGVMLIDANYGLSTMTLMSLNPALERSESGRLAVNPALDQFNPANGFRNGSAAEYPASFTSSFFSGVYALNEELIATAQDRLAAIEAGEALFDDDEPFYIPDGTYIGPNNKLLGQDPRLLAHTEHVWPLLTPTGIVEQVVHSVRVPSSRSPIHSMAHSYIRGALKTTVRRYLSTFAIRATPDYAITEDGIVGVDWFSSHMVPVAAVPGISVPLLTMGMTGHYEYLNAEKIYLASGSNDTAIVFVEGAEHNLDTCTACEQYAGQYGDTAERAYGYIAEWLGKEGRFMHAGA